MKLLLVGEYRDGRLAPEVNELFGFASLSGAEVSMVLVGTSADHPSFDGRLWLADIDRYGEYAPDLHRLLVLEAFRRESPDVVVFLHSSYGWDLAPRVAFALRAALVSGVSAVNNAGYVVDCCNGKLRRTVSPQVAPVVLTLQPGAFAPVESSGTVEIHAVEAVCDSTIGLLDVSRPESEVDLSRADVIVCAGRGIGSQEHIGLVSALARVLGGEVGASRPVVDAGWLNRERQIGMSGQSVSPQLYVACGISGSIQHLAGIRGSGFILAINTDRDAPIGSVADVLVVADLVEFLPLLTEAFESKS
jgi:electron transfer flavoprotein alpha subunit